MNTQTAAQGRKISISTEGRVFTAQLTRDLAARQAVGAALLSPAARRWPEAFDRFAELIRKTASPTKAAKRFRAGIDRLLVAQKEHAACMVNCFARRSRSAYVEVLGFDVTKHPLTNIGYDGILVGGHICLLQRTGRLSVGFSRLAFVSWHATLLDVGALRRRHLFRPRCNRLVRRGRDAAAHAPTGTPTPRSISPSTTCSSRACCAQPPPPRV